ncbi:MAG TPA: parallel beta-helix domain-containing protein, partial [Kofleriaceae bacterium]|nr:parallel beta-helix domain-containing protein [Kofleriaceae bacterium]
DRFVIEDLALEDSPGDLLKVVGCDGLIIRRVRTEWTNGPDTDNGAYGLYPVQCDNVLIEGSTVRGASDAGIYVGQSHTIIVRESTATENVAGIEIENSFDADVHDNMAMNNAGGILIFNLPGLEVENGARTRVFDNTIAGNNHENFAPEGNIVGKVPKGTGLAMIAAHNVEVFGNDIRDNQTASLAVVSYHVTGETPGDATYVQESDTVYIHDNTYTGNGTDPVDPLGVILQSAMESVDDEPPVEIPAIVWDGYVNADKADTDGTLKPEFEICIQEAAEVDFANIDWPNGYANVTQDLTPHDCTHEALPEVVLP